MATNRISGYYDSAKDDAQESQPVPEKGFATIPSTAITGFEDRWPELQQLYGVAYLMAHVGAELPRQG
ncbi:MAG: hypothetical protein IT428_07055 [Planctomycetaceae bacterium]|nr:hypothetical protein [Planctomycetaceae bacterium]